MFTNFFYLLRAYGVPVTVTEWMTLMDALDRGLAFSSLTGFYRIARSVLVKSEAYYDAFDSAFLMYFRDIETAPEVVDEAMKWVENAKPPLRVSPEEKSFFQEWDSAELRRLLEERLQEQGEEHHGGSYWIGTGGTSPFGHSGYHPAGVRIGGESVNRSAVQVASERRFRDFRTNETLQTRHFEMALRRLRNLSVNEEGPREVLDIQATIDATSRNAGNLEPVWTRPRKNTVKLVLLMDAGGSMNPYAQLCNRLFKAAERAGHFKELHVYYFHNCVYEHIFFEPFCRYQASMQTLDFLRKFENEYKLIFVGDASMAPGELLMKYGALDWNFLNEEPGITWLQRIVSHFSHVVWLNPIPEKYWGVTEGAYTIQTIANLVPMFELTLDGVGKAVQKLMVKK